MTVHFNSLGEMAIYLATRPAEIAIELHHGLETILRRIEATAKAEMGVYQEQTGPFPGWPELADATKDDRVRLGFTENDPLRRTGETAETISHQIEGLDGYVGSPDEKMVWFEFGTERMPARPVLGPAAFTNKALIQKLVGAAVMAGLIGSAQVHSALGYDFEAKD